MEEIIELLEQNKLAELKEILINENPIDIADVFEEFPKEKYLIIFKLLPKDFSSEVFSYLFIKFSLNSLNLFSFIASLASFISFIKKCKL